MMKKLCLFFWGMLLILPLSAAVTVKNLKVQQRWPWNGLVDITYSVDCSLPAGFASSVEVKLFFSGYDQDQNKTVEMKSLSGDGVGAPVPVGRTCRTVWNAARDYPEFNSSAFKVQVTGEAKIPEKQPPRNSGTYLVIDLAGGSWRYSDSAPDLSDDRCRTTELWLRKIPAGTFLMGSPDDELGKSREWWNNEWRVRDALHAVTITRPFYIGVFEITQKQWKLVMGKGSFLHSGDVRPADKVSYEEIRGGSLDKGLGWPEYGHAVDEGSFLARIRARTGLMLDLPTDAQWEYACRGGTVTALNSGRNLTATNEYCPNQAAVGRAYCNKGDGRGGYAEHTKVGSYLPNSWGLYDMHGNVEEWCLDWWQADLGSAAVVDPVGPRVGMAHVIRGGGWNLLPLHVRSASRTYNAVYYTHDGLGLRLVCIPPVDREKTEN